MNLDDFGLGFADVTTPPREEVKREAFKRTVERFVEMKELATEADNAFSPGVISRESIRPLATRLGIAGADLVNFTTAPSTYRLDDMREITKAVFKSSVVIDTDTREELTELRENYVEFAEKISSKLNAIVRAGHVTDNCSAGWYTGTSFTDMFTCKLSDIATIDVATLTDCSDEFRTVMTSIAHTAGRAINITTETASFIRSGVFNNTMMLSDATLADILAVMQDDDHLDVRAKINTHIDRIDDALKLSIDGGDWDSRTHRLSMSTAFITVERAAITLSWLKNVFDDTFGVYIALGAIEELIYYAVKLSNTEM